MDECCHRAQADAVSHGRARGILSLTNRCVPVVDFLRLIPTRKTKKKKETSSQVGGATTEGNKRNELQSRSFSLKKNSVCFFTTFIYARRRRKR